MYSKLRTATHLVIEQHARRTQRCMHQLPHGRAKQQVACRHCGRAWDAPPAELSKCGAINMLPANSLEHAASAKLPGHDLRGSLHASTGA